MSSRRVIGIFLSYNDGGNMSIPFISSPNNVFDETRKFNYSCYWNQTYVLSTWGFRHKRGEETVYETYVVR